MAGPLIRPQQGLRSAADRRQRFLLAPLLLLALLSAVCFVPSAHQQTRQSASKVARGAKGSKKAAKAALAGPANEKVVPRSEDWSEWYRSLIAAADLVADVPVRGCKVLKPGGFALWESIRGLLDPKIKAMGVQNAYFPVLIPVSFLAKEADHVAGFAKECAVVTHYRLRETEPDPEDKAKPLVEVDPESKLADPYVVRPTSETVVWHMYGQWINSYRDLPLKMNQWANVMRWEHRTKPFLRSAEFLWQEGHTAHATKEDAVQQARDALDAYVAVVQDELAIPLIPGEKSAVERFAGADQTFTIEVLAQNGMAIQAGTSHFLGQNFAKAFDVKYATEEQDFEYVWATSWGVSTRLIGAAIMVHSDDDGLALPPALAGIQVVIVPMHNKDPEKLVGVKAAAEELFASLTKAGVRAHLDGRFDMKPGAKYYEWERKGVPLRLELGARDLEQGAAMAKMRTGGDKFPVKLGESAASETIEALAKVKAEMWKRAQEYNERLTFTIDSREAFDARLKEREVGFMVVPWGGDDEDEEKLADDTGVTLRCYPLEQPPLEEGQLCPLTGKPARIWAYFAKAF